jgi:hypothetical protein
LNENATRRSLSRSIERSEVTVHSDEAHDTSAKVSPA